MRGPARRGVRGDALAPAVRGSGALDRPDDGGPPARGDRRRGGAATLRGEAFEEAPATSGTLDGRPFAWIADADSRLGPILEAVVNGRYYWVPFHRIRRIEVDEPADLRDVVWTPVHTTWANGGEGVAFVPTRYVGSEEAEDPAVRLARRTVWAEHGNGVFHGSGQRILATDADEVSLMDVRRVELDTAPPEVAEAGAGSDDG